MSTPAPDTVRAAWAGGRAARNGWLTVPDPHLVEVVAAHAAGHGLLDALTLDLQHGLFDRARGRMVGSDEYLTKPFTKDTLLTAVREHACVGA